MAAEAALAAGDQGKYWEMHDALLKNSPRLDRESLMKYAKDIGLDLARFRQSVDARRHSADIDRDLKLAADLDLYNTPTYFINGRKVIGNRPYEYLRDIVEEELKNAKK